MRSWKGKLPDVEVDAWETIGSGVLAQLRQPAWEDATWFQVLTVEGSLIRRLEDHPTRESALDAIDRVEPRGLGANPSRTRSATPNRPRLADALPGVEHSFAAPGGPPAGRGERAVRRSGCSVEPGTSSSSTTTH
jgi:hypothetical protein